MHERSEDFADELDHRLNRALADAGMSAQRAVAARAQAIRQSQREGTHAWRAVQAQFDAERLLATERLRPVFEPEWWETAGPHEIAEMWREANSWRDPDCAPATPNIFDHAAQRIRSELRARGEGEGEGDDLR